MRGALREFIQELRSAQRERVRLGMSDWLGNWVAERLQLVRAGGLPSPPILGLQDELRAQTSALSHQLAEMEAEKDSATSRARQLQKAMAQSEEGECDPLGSCFALSCS